MRLNYRCASFGGLVFAFNSHATPAMQLQLAVGNTQLLYREFLSDGSEFNREQGDLPTLFAGLRLGLNDDLSWTFSGEQLSGTLAYKGQSQGGTPSNSHTEETLTTWLTGVQYAPADSHWSGALSYGNRDWHRNIRANNITGELNEYYRWQVLEAAAGWHDTLLGVGWQAELAYSLLFNGEIDVDLRPYYGRKGSANLANGHEYAGTLGVNLLETQVGTLQLITRYSALNAGQSATGHAGVIIFKEPRSTDNRFTYMLAWQMGF